MAGFGERAISIVVVQKAAAALEHAWNAVETLPEPVVPTGPALRGIVIDEIAHEQVQFAVVIVVEPEGGGGPPGTPNTGLISHVRERAISIVSVQNVPAVAGQVDIGEAVAIEVSDRHAFAPTAAVETR